MMEGRMMTSRHVMIVVLRGIRLTRRSQLLVRALVALVACTLVSFQFAAQSSVKIEERWQERLAALDPSRPFDYFLLGEEIADAAQSAQDFELARDLFGYAGALDTARLGRSAMLAIASISVGTDRARALIAAEVVGGRGFARYTERIEPATVDALGKSFSHFRRGNGSAAGAALKQADADATLTRFDRALPGGAQAYREDCKRLGKNGTQADWPFARALMDVELALRQGAARSLSLELALEGDEPLLEIDMSDPATLWGVDPNRPWWREGRWSGNE